MTIHRLSECELPWDRFWQYYYKVALCWSSLPIALINPESGGAMVLTPALPAAPAEAHLVFRERSELTSLRERPQLCYRALKGRLCNSSASPKQCQCD